MAEKEEGRIPGVIVHGGAGAMRTGAARLARYRAGLAEACEAGYARLAAGASALDAVEAAVRAMELSGAFNAGRGACLNIEGEVECDAAIMEGDGLRAGACGALKGFLHPISVARKILEETDHVLIVGEGAARLAAALGAERTAEGPTPDRLQEYKEVMAKIEGLPRGARLERLSALLRHGAEEIGAPPIGRGDTVGAVAIDARGRLAAAVSTGGLWLKLPGRVGDSALPGAGIYADDRAGAVSATGIGEAIIRVALSRRACEAMGEGATAREACARAIDLINERIGPDTAGLIGIDREGRPGAGFNTAGMGRGYMGRGMAAPVVAVGAEEAFV
jgi:beta-aspartyl-peptidase (threonine type)